jgi:hypothetical protein
MRIACWIIKVTEIQSMHCLLLLHGNNSYANARSCSLILTNACRPFPVNLFPSFCSVLFVSLHLLLLLSVYVFLSYFLHLSLLFFLLSTPDRCQLSRFTQSPVPVLLTSRLSLQANTSASSWLCEMGKLKSTPSF